METVKNSLIPLKMFLINVMYAGYLLVEILLWVRPVRLRKFPKHTDSADSRDSFR